nr:hypothetical protein [Crenothrix polyspora]
MKFLKLLASTLLAVMVLNTVLVTVAEAGKPPKDINIPPPNIPPPPVR